MAVEHVAVGVAVAGDVAVELPFTSKLVLQQPVVCAGWNAVDRVVSAGVISLQKSGIQFNTEKRYSSLAGVRTST